MQPTPSCFLCGRGQQTTLPVEDFVGRHICEGCARRVARLLFDLPTEGLGQLWPPAGSLDLESRRAAREDPRPACVSAFEAWEAGLEAGALTRAMEALAAEKHGGARRGTWQPFGMDGLESVGAGVLLDGWPSEGGWSRPPKQDGRPFALLGAARALIASEGSREARTRALNLLVGRELAVPDILVRLRRVLFPA